MTPEPDRCESIHVTISSTAASYSSTTVRGLVAPLSTVLKHAEHATTEQANTSNALVRFNISPSLLSQVNDRHTRTRLGVLNPLIDQPNPQPKIRRVIDTQNDLAVVLVRTHQSPFGHRIEQALVL